MIAAFEQRLSALNRLDSLSDIAYSPPMKEVRTAAEFDAWLDGLRDDRAVARIGKRIDRIEEGN